MATSGNRYLLDTTVFIDYLRGIPVAKQIIGNTRDPRLTSGYSVITETELWAGMRESDNYRQYLVLLSPYNRYFINLTIARRAGELAHLIRQSRRWESLPEITDCLIAATAAYHDLTIYTRNEKHFRHFLDYEIR